MSDNPDDLLNFFDSVGSFTVPLPEPPSPEEKINLLLHDYTNLENQLEAIHQEYENARFSLLTDEIRSKMVELDQLEREKTALVRESLDKLKPKITKATEELGRSVNTPKGIRSAIFTVRTEWDSKRLEGYAIEHPAILQLQSKKVVITIR